jgi:hypothetical protein
MEAKTFRFALVHMLPCFCVVHMLEGFCTDFVDVIACLYPICNRILLSLLVVGRCSLRILAWLPVILAEVFHGFL